MKHHKKYILLSISILLSIITAFIVLCQINIAPFTFLRGYAYYDHASLNGPDDIVCVDKYLIQAEFNTICLEATTELTALGYVEIQSSRIPNRTVFFRKLDETGDTTDDTILLTIGDKYNLLEDSNSPPGESNLASDWFTVQVRYHKPKNRLLEKTADRIAEQSPD